MEPTEEELAAVAARTTDAATSVPPAPGSTSDRSTSNPEPSTLAEVVSEPVVEPPPNQEILDRQQAMAQKILDLLGDDDSPEAASIRASVHSGIMDEQEQANLYMSLVEKQKAQEPTE